MEKRQVSAKTVIEEDMTTKKTNTWRSKEYDRLCLWNHLDAEWNDGTSKIYTQKF